MAKISGEFKGAAGLKRLLKPLKGKNYFKDSGAIGLYVSVSATGKTAWEVQIRFEGRPRWKTIGYYHADGGMSLAEARAYAEVAHSRARNGLDPFPEPDTFDHWWDKFTELREKKLGGRSLEQQKTLRRRIGGRWDGLPLEKISSDDCEAVLQDVEEQAILNPRTKHGKGAANNAHATLVQFFRYIEKKDLVPKNPMDRVERPHGVVVRKKVLSRDEFVALYRAAEEEDYPYQQIVKVAMLVPCRIWSEIAPMKRSEVRRGVWGYTVPKTGNRQELPLPPNVLAILDTCIDYGPHFFGKAAVSPGARVNLKNRMSKRVGDVVSDWTFHDFRTAFVTQLRELWVPFDLADQVQRPVDNSSAGRRHYDHSARASEKGEVLAYWSYVVEEWIAGRDPSDWRKRPRGEADD